MNILIYGIGGTMGRILYDCLKEEEELKAVCGVDKLLKENTFDIPVYSSCKDIATEKPNCIIDFSMHECVYDYLPYATENKIPCVIATTGFNETEQEFINNASKLIPIFQTGNMSLGVNLMLKLVKEASLMLGDKADIEIIEMHHNKKVDSPSGTALMLGNAVKSALANKTDFVCGRKGIVGKRTKNEIGIHSIRGGSIVGKHEVMFIMDNEIITVTHESQSKTIFALGSINAAKFLVKQQNGIYDMNDLLNDSI